MMTPRLERLRADVDRLGAASFLVSDPVNVFYLTGFESSNAFVLVKHKQVLLLTDGRYIEAARAVENGVEAVQLERELAADLGPGAIRRSARNLKMPAATTRSPGWRSRSPASPGSCTGSATESGWRFTSFRCCAIRPTAA
jgi:Xaa-Pro aminopeptidase